MMRAPWMVLAALVSACASAPSEKPALDLAPFTSFDTAAFPGAARVLTGFAPPDDDPAMRIGDAALLGLELHSDGSVERQLLLLEVHVLPLADGGSGGAPVRLEATTDTTMTLEIPTGSEPRLERRTWTVHPVDVRMSRHDADGTLRSESIARLYEEMLATGWWPNTTWGWPRGWHLAHALSLSLQELATTDAVLHDLLFRVVDRPSVWSIATHLGIKVSMVWELAMGEPPRRVAFAGLAAEVGHASCDLRVNGSTAAWLDLFVAQPKGATMVCGGLVGAIARHPTKPGRMAVVRLLATRRAPPPPG